MRVFSALFCAAALSFTSLPAQLIITEVRFATASDSAWIEVLNPTTSTVKMANWSIYHASTTRGRPNNYWWGFPSGSELRAGEYLRVHWHAPIRQPNGNEYYTGTHTLHFLFGLGSEALSRTAGSLALISTQNSTHVNLPSVFADWITWGSGNHRREELAVRAGLWSEGTFIAPAFGDESLALDYNQNTEPTSPRAFFHDATPTPLAHNHDGAASRLFGYGCSVGSINAPTLELTSLPVAGNIDFAINVIGTNGTFQNQFVILAFGPANPQGSFSLMPVLTCRVYVDVSAVVTLQQWAPGLGNPTTDFRFVIPEVPPGLTITCQAWVLNMPVYSADQAASKGMEINVGR